MIECSGVTDPVCVARFWSYVGEPDAAGCRRWTGNHKSKKSAHGAFQGGPKVGEGKKRRRKSVVASRFAWALAYGDPGDSLVLHSCDVDDCVERTHLRLGTHQDNSNDMNERFVSCRGGEGHGLAVLTHQEVVEVYDLAWGSPYLGKQIAALYHISGPHVSGIKHGHFRGRVTGHVETA